MMRKLFIPALGLLLGSAQWVYAEMPDRPLPPAPAEQMGAPADCDPTLRSSDPNAAVNRDCPTQPEPYGEQHNNRAQREKGKSQTQDPGQGGREVTSP